MRGKREEGGYRLGMGLVVYERWLQRIFETVCCSKVRTWKIEITREHTKELKMWKMLKNGFLGSQDYFSLVGIIRHLILYGFDASLSHCADSGVTKKFPFHCVLLISFHSYCS